MAFGKLFTRDVNIRSTAILAVAKANNVDLEKVVVDTANPTAEFLKYNKLGKVPTFVGDDGFVLTETMAIAIYITSQNEKTTLLGKTKQDYASILKWMSYANTELCSQLVAWGKPLMGLAPYNKKSVDEAAAAADKVVSVLEEHLLHNTFLVGERITLADLFVTSMIAFGFNNFYGKEWRAAHPNVSRWFETVYHQPIYSEVAPKFELLDAPKLINTPPKKVEQPKKAEQPKKEKATKPAKEADPEEDDAPKEVKPKHPLSLLPKSSFDLDEWKRTYSNKPTEESFPWFWQNCPFDEYSVWKVVYKYPEDLKALFMSRNLIGGFFARLEASRKYIFGCASVYGVDGDNHIQGAYVIRGHEFLPAFDVAPDWESYSFERIDPQNPEDRAYVEAEWAWERDIDINGKKMPWADADCFR